MILRYFNRWWNKDPGWLLSMVSGVVILEWVDFAKRLELLPNEPLSAYRLSIILQNDSSCSQSELRLVCNDNEGECIFWREISAGLAPTPEEDLFCLSFLPQDFHLHWESPIETLVRIPSGLIAQAYFCWVVYSLLGRSRFLAAVLFFVLLAEVTVGAATYLIIFLTRTSITPHPHPVTGA